MPVLHEETEEYIPEEHDTFDYSETQTSMVNKTVFGTGFTNGVGTATVSMFTVPDGYIFKINSIQHSIIMNAAVDSYASCYVFTDVLNVSTNKNNIISFVQCVFNSNQIANLALKEPYIVLAGQTIKFSLITSIGNIRSNTIVSLIGTLEPVNT
jgi:hypothetical protein